MTLIDELLASIEADMPLRSVTVGAHMTAVASRGCGIAATFVGDGAFMHVPVRGVGDLLRMSARELAEYARSDHPLESTLGIAALNSLLRVDTAAMRERNASEIILERGRGRKVALVGHFPFIPKLAGAVDELWVLEKRPMEGEYPAEAAPELIPRADVVAITGSALVNHTLEGLLNLCSPEAFVVVLGPSAPLSPVLFGRGVSVICGAVVTDETALLRGLTQGGHFRQFEGTRMLCWERGGTRRR
ncbi:MAG TPA: hypothetical protein DFS52_22005 [Myxococcales bacterium]|nr:hypothetical protein [Myxococcales bacterium]